jgi:hypothetical protein
MFFDTECEFEEAVEFLDVRASLVQVDLIGLGWLPNCFQCAVSLEYG